MNSFGDRFSHCIGITRRAHPYKRSTPRDLLEGDNNLVNLAVIHPAAHVVKYPDDNPGTWRTSLWRIGVDLRDVKHLSDRILSVHKVTNKLLIHHRNVQS